MEKNEISRALRKLLNASGLKKLRVRGGTGTAWGWISLFCQEGHGQFLPEEMQKLYELGIAGSAERTNCLVFRMLELEAIINRINFFADFPQLEKYKKLKECWFATACSLPDGGTCCLGSGLFIKHNGKVVDFWRNDFAQSDGPVYHATEQLKDCFVELGLETVHEAGVMD